MKKLLTSQFLTQNQDFSYEDMSGYKARQDTTENIDEDDIPF